jgi:RluA family pseudouridine synthase
MALAGPPRRPGDRERGDLRWVVEEGDGKTVGDVARRAGADDAAVREGRVFVDRRRIGDASATVEVGQELTVAARRTAAPSVRVLADEDGLVAVDKPAGMSTIPDQTGSAASLLLVLSATLGCKPTDLHATSRLDREVSGVVVFARTREAASRLVEARRQGVYERRYVAIACRAPEPPAGVWDAPIGRAKDPRKRAAFGRDAVPARSRYEVVGRAGDSALLALEPETGRTHQLRVHAAHAGAPLLGDGGYGGETRRVLASGRVLGVRRIALHAWQVVVPRSGGGVMEVRAEVPGELREIWGALGGSEEAWGAALLGG